MRIAASGSLFVSATPRKPSHGDHNQSPVYPGQRAGGIEADMMAANELSTHAFIQAMLNPDYHQRPIAEAVLSHRFMTGAVL
ncbi:hypothetical protein COCNU_07G003670 [Cocos nucifera]|uniref:Uncharacterized protein n=1 Tax=Cocos nucifera TaxID=13894 RepID=A0A8K0IE32_COCNU|nr:hypothetical protein COCNU_07G003670 [Cocos nucifera]